MADLENAEISEVQKAAVEQDNEQVGAEKEPQIESEASVAAVEPAEAPAAEPAAEAEEPPAAAADRNSRASAAHDSSNPAEPTASAPAGASAAASEQQQLPVAHQADEHAAEQAPAGEAYHATAEAEPEQQQAEAEQQQAKLEEQHEQQQHSSMHDAHEAHEHIHFSPNHTQQHKHKSTVAASHRSIGPGTIYRSADGRMLTFTKPPYTYKARPYSRVDFSHSKNRLMKIAHDNQLLVSHLTVISKQVPSWTKDASAPPAPGNTASAAVNRRKNATVIAQENHALYQRLVAIRPSKDISRDTLEAGYRQNEVYKANCAQFKPSSKAAASH